jgi:regulatory factor X
MQSVATHSVHEQQFAGEPVDFKGSWYENQGNGVPSQQHGFDGVNHQISAGGIPREYGIDPALEAAVNHSSIVYQQENAYRPEMGRHSLPADGYGTSFAEDDSPLLEGRSDEQDDVDSVNGAAGQKKAGRSSAANEMEMRHLLAANRHRSLPEVAKELHGNERGPNSERVRQIFAMLW